MCIVPKMSKPTVNQAPQPEATAAPQDPTQNRKAEDKALFGGVPDLRIDPSATAGGATAGGAGLKMQ